MTHNKKIMALTAEIIRLELFAYGIMGDAESVEDNSTAQELWKEQEGLLRELRSEIQSPEDLHVCLMCACERSFEEDLDELFGVCE